MGEMDQECIVIGAGIIGLATAEALLERGVSVTLLERGSVGQESSWAGGGILSPLCPWDYAEPVTQLTGYSASLYKDWVRRLHDASGLDPEYVISGMRILPPVKADIALQWCKTHQVNIVQHENALWLPDVAQVRNPRLLHALRVRVGALGGHILEQCAVTGFSAQSGRIQAVNTTSGIRRADHFIVTAGAWSREVMGDHALGLDIRPVLGQMLLFKCEEPPLPHILLQEDFYLIPRRDGHLLAGSTLEETGFAKIISQKAREHLLQRARNLLPRLQNTQPVRQWAGLRPASPHNIPVIGRHPHLDNLYINSGHFRYGVTMAPASAQIVANELDGSAQPLDIAPYQTGWSLRD